MKRFKTILIALLIMLSMLIVGYRGRYNPITWLRTIRDVNITEPESDNDILQYDLASDQWKNSADTAAGFLIDYDDDSTTGKLTARGYESNTSGTAVSPSYGDLYASGMYFVGPVNPAIRFAVGSVFSFGYSNVTGSLHSEGNIDAASQVIAGTDVIANTMTLSTGSIADSTGAITFNNENITYNGGYARFSTETPTTNAKLSYKTANATPTNTGILEIIDTDLVPIATPFAITTKLNHDINLGGDVGGVAVAIAPTGTLSAPNTNTIFGMFGGIAGTYDTAALQMPDMMGVRFSSSNDQPDNAITGSSKGGYYHVSLGAELTGIMGAATDTWTGMIAAQTAGIKANAKLRGTYNATLVNQIPDFNGGRGFNAAVWAVTTDNLVDVDSTGTDGSGNDVFGLYIDACASGGHTGDFKSYGVYNVNDVPNVINGEMYVGSATIPTEPLQVGDGTNHTEFEDDGTIEFIGDATVWNDIVFPLSTGKLLGANQPDYTVAIAGNVYEYTFAINDIIDVGSQEVPHSYKEGSDFDFHVHIITNGLDATDRYVRYSIEYIIADMGEVTATNTLPSPDLLIPASTTDRTHIYFDMGDITGTNYKIGATIKFRFSRVALAGAGTAPSNDPFVTMVGCHIEEDTVGSRTEATK